MKTLLLFLFVVAVRGWDPWLQESYGGSVETLAEMEEHGIDVKKSDKDVLEDAFLTTPELLTKYGYPVEIHKVVTEDEYILEMHRIPRPGAIPVYLQHGIMDSSAGWVFMGPRSAFAYFFADLGYDVWLGNGRGNRYSRNHKNLKPESAKFWDYSFNEMGYYDLPAMIDHVLNQTEYKKLHYVGHSQGTSAFWAMCSDRPEYCDKVLSMQALAPVAYVRYVKSPVIRALAPFTGNVQYILNMMGLNEFKPSSDFLKFAGQALCSEESVTQAICSNSVFLLAGYNSEQLNKTMIPVIFGHLPAGGSVKQLAHFGQMVNSGRFRKFDYGLLQNRAKYGTFSPPSYNLKMVTAPVALHFSMNDWLADIRDVHRLRESLPNVYKDYLVPLPKFNHIDFLTAMNGRDLLQFQVLSCMRKLETKEIDFL